MLKRPLTSTDVTVKDLHDELRALPSLGASSTSLNSSQSNTSVVASAATRAQGNVVAYFDPTADQGGAAGTMVDDSTAGVTSAPETDAVDDEF